MNRAYLIGSFFYAIFHRKGGLMIKLFSLFSGIGAFEKALERLKIEYELVGFSEIDKYAIKSYCAIHNVSEDKNYGDISKINENNLPDFDIMTWRVSMSGY